MPANQPAGVNWNEIRQRVLAGEKYREISRDLNSQGIKLSHVAISKRARKENWFDSDLGPNIVVRKDFRFVYAFYDWDYPSVVKIGVAVDTRERLSVLRPASGRNLMILKEWDCGDTAGEVEKTAHRILRKYRKIGEYFIVDHDIAVDSVNKAIADVQNKIPAWSRKNAGITMGLV